MEMNLRIIQKDDELTYQIENDKNQGVVYGSDQKSIENIIRNCNYLMKQLAITLKSIKIEDKRKEKEENHESSS